MLKLKKKHDLYKFPHSVQLPTLFQAAEGLFGLNAADSTTAVNKRQTTQLWSKTKSNQIMSDQWQFAHSFKCTVD